jgi:hypothetical protein
MSRSIIQNLNLFRYQGEQGLHIMKKNKEVQDEENW